MADVAYSPIFESVYEYAKALSMEDANKLLMACCAYAFGDDMPELDGIVKVIFEQTALPPMQKSLETARRNRANGKRRASQAEATPNPGASHTKPKAKRAQTQPEPNQSQTEATPEPNEATQKPNEANRNPLETHSEANPTQSEPTTKPTGTHSEATPNPLGSHSEPTLKPLGTHLEATRNPDISHNEPKRGHDQRPMTNDQIKPKRGGKFVPPPLEDVQQYGDEFCRERGLPTDFSGERFVNFYGSKGWKVGKNPMKSWKRAVANWILRDHPEGAQRRAKNGGQRDVFAAYD